MDLFIKKSNGFIKINKFSYPAIYHILNWSWLVMKATFSGKRQNCGADTIGGERSGKTLVVHKNL